MRATAFFGTLTVAGVALIACTENQDNQDNQATTRVQALVSPIESTIPCEARAAAITATSGNVTINSSSEVDSYHSEDGAYGDSNVGTLGTIRAAGEIIQNGGTISGTQLPNSPMDMQIVPVPSGATPLPLGSSGPGNLNINGAADSIVLPPGDYVVENLNVNSPGSIGVEAGGPVRIWVTGNLNLGGSVNEGGTPSDLTFLINSSGYVNVNSGGPLHGSIYAPTSTVNVNSPVFGSVIGAQVTLNSGAAVHFDQFSACDNPSEPQAPRPLPRPPLDKGCYIGTIDGWQGIPCTEGEAAVYDDFGTPDPAIETIPPGTGPRRSFEFGQVETTMVAFGGVNNVDTTTGDSLPNSLSLQLNTNEWEWNAAGNEAIVQLVVQTKQNSAGTATNSRVCIWNIDVDAALAGDGSAYVATCIGGTTGFTLPTRHGSFQEFDFATVAGSTYNDTAGDPVIGLVAQLSWWDPANDPENYQGLYAVVADDTYGLAGNWTETSGTLFGVGDKTEAQFTDSSVLTRLLSGSCANSTGPSSDIPWPGACPSEPPLLPDTRLTTTSGVQTAETNNLTDVGSPTSLVAITNDLVYTQYLSSTSGSCIAGDSRLFVRDNPEDTGAVPSSLGGQPFWNSPDLFVVPADTPVDVDGVASSVVITSGEEYDVYVRVNNEYGCQDATGVKALVYLADPAALSAPWISITGDQYLGGPAAPGGHVIPSGARGLIGPFRWTAPTDLESPHKCLLAAIESDGQPAPTNTFDAPASYQVAQRNVQFVDCDYPLTNATTQNGTVALDLTVPDGLEPALTGSPVISVSFYDPAATWFGIWQPGAGADYSIASNAGVTTIRLGSRSVSLAPVPLAAGQTVLADTDVVLPTNSPTTEFNLAATLFDSTGSPLVTNGGTCRIAAPRVH